jgi:hypothetical protein
MSDDHRPPVSGPALTPTTGMSMETGDHPSARSRAVATEDQQQSQIAQVHDDQSPAAHFSVVINIIGTQTIHHLSAVDPRTFLSARHPILRSTNVPEQRSVEVLDQQEPTGSAGASNRVGEGGTGNAQPTQYGYTNQAATEFDQQARLSHHRTRFNEGRPLNEQGFHPQTPPRYQQDPAYRSYLMGDYYGDLYPEWLRRAVPVASWSRS